DPVRNQTEPGGIRQRGQPLTAPAGDIGHQNVTAQMELRLVEHPPAAGSTYAAPEWPAQGVAQHGIGQRMPGGWPRMNLQLTVDDLPHDLRGQFDQILVACITLGRFVHAYLPGWMPDSSTPLRADSKPCPRTADAP